MKNYLNIFLCILSLSACSQNKIEINMENSSDKEQILQSYKEMYSYMVSKDTAKLSKLMTDDFVLIHMTGMRQNKETYLRCIADGTLNYFSAIHENLEVSFQGEKAILTGQSKVTAAVFGGGKNTWHLQLKFWYIKKDGRWLQYQSQASTY